MGDENRRVGRVWMLESQQPSKPMHGEFQGSPADIGTFHSSVHSDCAHRGGGKPIRLLQARAQATRSLRLRILIEKASFFPKEQKPARVRMVTINRNHPEFGADAG